MKANLIPVPFYLDESNIEAQLEVLSAELADMKTPVNTLLITDPNNPLGTIYRKDTVKAMVRWCLRKKVHYVSDEIYALSVYEPSEKPFSSGISLAQDLVAVGEFCQEEVDTYVHLIYGLDKDWCASGLRVGLLYSRNQAVHRALASLAGFCGVSNHTQHTVAEVLADTDWTHDFIAKNSKLLEQSYEIVVVGLQSAGIPFTPAVAAMFVWIDMREWLSERTWEGEAALWQRICDSCKVILIPGRSFRAAVPGFFRLCFTAMPKEAVEEALRRIKEELKK